jgi:hypothetical protein
MIRYDLNECICLIGFDVDIDLRVSSLNPLQTVIVELLTVGFYALGQNGHDGADGGRGHGIWAERHAGRSTSHVLTRNSDRMAKAERRQPIDISIRRGGIAFGSTPS